MGILDPIPVPRDINAGVINAKQMTMLTLLGNPRGSYTQACQAIENPEMLALFETRSVGPFRVSGLRPALASLEKVLLEVKGTHPDVHAALGTAGMTCARLVRGSTSTISNHSWGTAIDLKLNGALDRRGDGKVQEGLARIAPIFNKHGWFWGAGFQTEDGMHFEVGDGMIREWHASGELGKGTVAPKHALSLGDRGPEVRNLQNLLLAAGFDVKVDGSFGPKTLDAVRAFQKAAGLNADGIVGDETLAALRNKKTDPRPGGQLPRGTLSVGDSSAPVKKLQEQLNVLGHGLVVDGVFGRGVLAAVMAFQAGQGLEVDGIAGEATRARLDAMVPPEPS
jgi:peptidoglycan hydrolase-like protein with peptidoglycan-binding domain